MAPASAMMAARESPEISILLPDLRTGGAERVSVNLANELARRGMAVELVLLRNEGALRGELTDRVSLHSLDAPRLRSALLPLVRYLRRRRPPALLAAMSPLTSVAILARALARTPTRVVVADHIDYIAAAADNPLIAGTTTRLSIRWSYGHADAIVAVSDGVAESLCAFAGLRRERIVTIHNPVTPLPPAGTVDPDIFAGWARPGRRRLIAVGALKRQKDFPTLVRAVARLAGSMPVSLLILGEGPERGAIEALAAALGLIEVVVLPGSVPNPQAYLREADLFVLSSIYEGLSCVLIEALACGTPVVSTDCRSGPREILQDGRHGRFVPVGDDAALANAILASLGETHDQAALIRRSEDFSIAKATDAYLRLLLPGRRP
jgi:glycosyltransferase involved in cell wall biosynthesis